MVTLTPITTPKNATSMTSTLRPVSGFGETEGLCIEQAPAAHGATKLSVAEAASPSPISVTWNFTGIDFAGLSSTGAVTSTRSSAVWSRPITIIGRSGVTESTPTIWIVAFFQPSTSTAMTRSNRMLVEQADRIGVADRAVAEPDRDRIAVVQHVDVKQRTRHQGIQHDGSGHGNDQAIDDGARPDDPVDRRLAGLAAMNVDVIVVTDQARFPADLPHDAVAGVDAETALDAFELRAVAAGLQEWRCNGVGFGLIAPRPVC